MRPARRGVLYPLGGRKHLLFRTDCRDKGKEYPLRFTDIGDSGVANAAAYLDHYGLLDFIEGEKLLPARELRRVEAERLLQSLMPGVRLSAEGDPTRP